MVITIDKSTSFHGPVKASAESDGWEWCGFGRSDEEAIGHLMIEMARRPEKSGVAIERKP